MNEDIVYSDIKFRQSSSGKQNHKPEGNGESGTIKQEAIIKTEETVKKKIDLRQSETFAKNGVLILCFLLLILAIVVSILYIQEKRRNDDCLMQTKTLENNFSILFQKCSQLSDGFCNHSNATQCSLNPWGTSIFSGWTTYFGNSTYFFSNEQLNWENSKNACLLMTSHLAVINSKEEQIFLKNSSSIKNKPLWIGFTDQKEEGKWCWVDDPACNTPNVTFWGEKQPDNHNNDENCATENYNNKSWMTWNDDNCQKNYNWICEKSVIPIFL
ncbi:CD209 antigen-like protein E [Protopterus annectens]|uniref:CD209 antigen-like protein E n=1 Tax=Protopterus annectens TaxID=7888 RepID=UPI001CF9EF55|nr:CD209 antigen-like protein E [Protopterus annectens]